MKDRRNALSQKQEKDGMVRFGGIQNPRSGATAIRKHDGRTTRTLGNELIEFKRTDNRSQISIKTKDLLSVEVHALAEGRTPILGFDLGGRHYIVMPEEVYLERRVSTPSPRRSLGRNRRPSNSTIGSNSSVHDTGEMPGSGARIGKSVLLRISRQPGGSSGKIDMPGNTIRGGRRVSRPIRVSKVGGRETGASGGVGRGIRTRTSKNS